MSEVKLHRRCGVCQGLVTVGDVCPRCRARLPNKPRLIRSAWMFVGAALMLLVALYLWSNRLSGSSQSLHSAKAPSASTWIVADGSEQPGAPERVAFQSERCIPWAISKVQKPPPDKLSYLVISGKMVDPAGLVLSGFADECGQNLKVFVHENTKEGQLKQAISLSPPAAVIAVGKGAVLRARSEAADVPILFAHVVDPHALDLNESKMACVSPWVPAKPMMRHLLNILPKNKSLAFLYPAGPFATLAEQAARYATDSGRHTTLLEIPDRKQVDLVLSKAISQAEAWIVFPDRMVIDREVFNRILVTAERNAIPVGVPDEEHVRRGALVGVGPDSFRIGRQLCRLAGAIYRGELPSNGRVFCPEYSFAAINNAVVEKLGYTLELNHVKQAKLYKWH